MSFAKEQCRAGCCQWPLGRTPVLGRTDTAPVVTSLLDFCVHFVSAHFPNSLFQNSYESMEHSDSCDSLLGNQFLIGFVEIQHLIIYGHVRQNLIT